MATNSRETRRRKILDRGTDRLALIQGQGQGQGQGQEQGQDQGQADRLAFTQAQDKGRFHCNSLSGINHVPDIDSPRPSHERHMSDQPSAGFLKRSNVVISRHDDDIEDDKGEYFGRNLASPLPKLEPIVKDSGGHHTGPDYKEISLGSPLVKRRTNIEPVGGGGAPPVLDKVRSPSPVSVSGKNSPRYETHRLEYAFFTPRQISCAFLATKRTRFRCCAVIALLVVLSHLGFPILGFRFIKGIICLRPLYLVMLTNLSVVLARLLADNEGGFHKVMIVETEILPSSEEADWAEQASYYLEIGLMMKQVLDSLFIDAGVYAIFITCGISIGQALFWR